MLLQMLLNVRRVIHMTRNERPRGGRTVAEAGIQRKKSRTVGVQVNGVARPADKQVVIRVALAAGLMKIDPSECHFGVQGSPLADATKQALSPAPTRALDRCRRSRFVLTRSKRFRIVFDLLAIKRHRMVSKSRNSME